ncbi:MAG: hypothetical protein ACE5FH_03490 [Candidatus Zixiibacteriota bacterium]
MVQSELAAWTGKVLQWVFRQRCYKEIIVICTLAIVLRLLLMAYSIGQIGDAALFETSPDTINYMNAARGLAGLGAGDEATIFGFGPGYPVFLSIFLLLS